MDRITERSEEGRKLQGDPSPSGRFTCGTLFEYYGVI